MSNRNSLNWIGKDHFILKDCPGLLEQLCNVSELSLNEVIRLHTVNMCLSNRITARIRIPMERRRV